jgi:hypothetical protein
VDERMKKKKNRIEVNCWLCFVRMPSLTVQTRGECQENSNRDRQ